MLNFKNKFCSISKSKGNQFSVLLLALALLTGCSGFFGKKTDLGFLPTPDYSARTIQYVPILPEIFGSPQFTNPVQVLTGFDNLIYVVDSNSVDSLSAVYCFDQSGKQLARYSLPGVTYVAQDRNLEMLALTKFDTIISGNKQKLNAICRYNLTYTTGGSDGGGTFLSLNKAKLKTRMVYPIFTRETQRLQAPAELRKISLNAIGILNGNRYYVTCSGPSQQAFNYSFPNNCILFCNDPTRETSKAAWSPVAVLADNGTYGTDYFQQPFGIATTIQPPQSFALGSNAKDDFVFTSLDANSDLRVQYIQAQVSGEGFVNYSLKPFVVGDTSKASGFLYSSKKFTAPTGVTIAGDGTKYLFVTDAAKDTLYQFTIDGLEGVKPNVLSSSKLVKVSFGNDKKSKNGALFNRLRSVAYADKIVYLADAGNRRIIRYKLTTDFN